MKNVVLNHIFPGKECSPAIAKTPGKECSPATLFILIVTTIILSSTATAQRLYQQSIQMPSSTDTLVFLHGGPGYNSVLFELAVAQNLADENISTYWYDRRGCGRSVGVPGSYTFEEAVSDLLGILDSNGISQAVLMGHSFGGALAIRFAKVHPDRVRKIILVGAPINYPRTFRTIQKKCREYYQSTNNASGLQYISLLEQMDTTKLEYATYSFLHAMQCGLYAPSRPTTTAKNIQREMLQHPAARYLSDMQQPPVAGFYSSESYTTQDFLSLVKGLPASIEIHGIYGEEDGLFDEDSLFDIRDNVITKTLVIIEDASHSVFIDQREKFVSSVVQMIR